MVQPLSLRLHATPCSRSVSCWDPRTRDLIARISLPASNVTSCAFDGENLDELYIPTARAGGIFGMKLRVKGTPAYAFAG